MINIECIKKSNLVKSPFRYSFIRDCLPDEVLSELLITMPADNYYRSLRESGSDKTYNVVNNLLLKLGDKEYNKQSNLSASWIKLINSLQSEAYINAMSNLLEENLAGCHQEITLKRYGKGDFISAHTDKENVRATHMIFLNKNWDKKWGGCFCLMYDEARSFEKVLPISSCSIAFVRSENSWHCVEEIKEQSAERIAIQIAFWNITERNVLPGRTEENVVLNTSSREVT